MNPFLSELYSDLKKFEEMLKNHGAPRSIQSRASDARNAITWLQEEWDKQ